MSVRRSLIVLAIAAVITPVVAVFLGARQAERQQVEQQDFLQNLETYTVSRGDVEVLVSALGAVEAEEVLDLSFTVGGRVANVFIEEGAYVTAGTPLVMLENAEQRVAYEQALTGRDIAELYWRDISVVDDDDVRIAQANLDAARGTYQAIADQVTEDDIRAAEIAYQSAQEAYNAAIEARRIAGADQAAIDLLDAQIGQASFDMEIARLQVEELQNSNQGSLGAAAALINQRQRELDRVLAGADATDIALQEVGILEAEAQIADAETAFNDTILRAPFDGIVSVLDVEVGQVVGVGERIVELTDITPLLVKGEIDEVDIRAVETGMVARVELDALDDTLLDAQLVWVSPEGDSSAGVVSYDAEFSLIDEDARVRPGMTAEAFIITERKPNVLVVPNRFVRLNRRDNSVGTVATLNPDGTLNELTVRVGVRGDRNTEIVSGLSEGDTIVLDTSAQGATTGIFGE